MTRIGPLFDSQDDHSAETRTSLAEAIRICTRLREFGHVAYFAGGCVRDALLGREPKDFDVATDATPDRVREIFGPRKTLAYGASFGVIGVLPENPRRESSGNSSAHSDPQTLAVAPSQPTEVATFRSDGIYSDGRRPDQVHFGDALHDALRRDFTINGLFFDPLEETVIDHVGGRNDLGARIVRTIGNAADRFGEDKLRMLRAVRFATTLGFGLENETADQIRRRGDEITVVSAERIGAEMRRIVQSANAPRGIRLLVECGLQRTILPELRPSDLCRIDSLLDHRTVHRFESSLALILFAISESESESDRDRNVQNLTHAVAARWRLSGEETRRVLSALRGWAMLSRADHLKWSTVQPWLVDRDVECVVEVAEAIVAADDRSPEGINRCRQALQWPPQQLNPPPLISGETLRESGYPAGPNFKHWLSEVRAMQLDGMISTRQQAIDHIARLNQPR